MDILGGLINGISNVVGSGLNAWSQAQTNAQNMDLQKQQWAREDNAMQRKVADLQAAGLNPVLAASGGGSPTSITAHLQAPQYGDAFSKGVSGFLSGQAQQQAIARSQIDNELATKVAEVGKKAAEYDLDHAEEFNAARRNDILNRTMIGNYELAKAVADADTAKAQSQTAVRDNEIYKTLNLPSTMTGNIGNLGAVAASVINSLQAKGLISK